MSPYDVTQIVKTVLEEWEGEPVEDEEAFIENVKLSLQKDLSAIEQYSAQSTRLSLVRFQCMLQDTGYPLEVYAESGDGQNRASGTSHLKERWIGWGVEVPGQSRWASNAPIESAAASLSLRTSSQLNPRPMAIKYPLPEKRSSYLGAMITIYDESITLPPASVHTFVGILSRTGLPSVEGELGPLEVYVPALHVLAGPLPAQETGEVDEHSRAETLDHLSSLVGGDKVAGEYLLLNLLSRPSIRPNGLPPLGTLSLNLIYPDATNRLNPQDLSLVVPRVVHLPLTISSLHSDVFIPSSPASVSLNSGILQLAPDTLLVVDETHLGEGGKLEEKAIKNLQALQGCLNDQKVPYDYPYMPDLKMECSIKGLILSEGGRGIVRADVSLPVDIGVDAVQRPTGQKLDKIRTYLQACGSSEHARTLVIPDEVGNVIQDAFVSMRSAGAKGEDAEAALKRRMRIARLLAISHSAAVLDTDVWERASNMDEEAQRRLSVKAAKPN